jgi:hypothetical protein
VFPTNFGFLGFWTLVVVSIQRLGTHVRSVGHDRFGDVIAQQGRDRSPTDVVWTDVVGALNHPLIGSCVFTVRWLFPCWTVLTVLTGRCDGVDTPVQIRFVHAAVFGGKQWVTSILVGDGLSLVIDIIREECDNVFRDGDDASPIVAVLQPRLIWTVLEVQLPLFGVHVIDI